MYLSHPVRRMRNDPGEATVGLVVELGDDAEPASLRETVAAANGELVDDLGFGCWLVSLPEAGVDALCSLDGVVRVETDATLERGVDETVDADLGEGGADDSPREV
ncbi:hypothetical protein SY89_02649 [Halolamina pelagica]|uniref:Putative peptidase inhibitor domain-containing protein n=1 Tax=Halolamina pelagica TaxID=699431 RepID=A0A0P7GRF4_9EURY|nr:hypothetical protein [Halolamina pelagica]KPN31892.1 hypothetical protein SY89_02649 [Halolamina pelagica]